MRDRECVCTALPNISKSCTEKFEGTWPKDTHLTSRLVSPALCDVKCGLASQVLPCKPTRMEICSFLHDLFWCCAYILWNKTFFSSPAWKPKCAQVLTANTGLVEPMCVYIHVWRCTHMYEAGKWIFLSCKWILPMKTSWAANEVFSDIHMLISKDIHFFTKKKIKNL